ncbi:WAT1-related protein At3g28050 [Linum perenne]
MTEGYVYRDVLPFSAMVIMQSVAVGLNTLFKAATMEGMSYHVFVAYIHAIGALVLLLPAHFFSYRLLIQPSATLLLLLPSYLLSLSGVCVSIFLILSLEILLTFDYNFDRLNSLMACVLITKSRMEKIVVRRRWSQAKVIGAIVSIGGAIVVTLYKGTALTTAATSQSTSQNWVLGGFFLTCQYILVPLWYIVQVYALLCSLVIKTQIMKEYPDELTVVFLYDLVVSIVAAVVALITEGTSPTAWILGPNIALASVFCSGILGSCLNIIVHTWALRIKGPVFVAMFRPLSIVIALVMGVVFLGDTLHLGSLVGAAVISIGFYTMMWGKAQEEQDLEE